MSDDGERKKFFSKEKFWAFLFFLLAAGLVYALVTFSYNLKKEMIDIRKTQAEQFARHIETNQFLLSTIDWSARRTSQILFMRDQVVAEWKRVKVPVNLDEAYLIAETVMRECESYSYIEPFLILATQNVESSFNRIAKSNMGALGLNQFMPSTGRILAGYFGYEYSDSLLYNILVSTRFAVKLIDILHAQYEKWDIVLADYNGGPRQAYYYRFEKKSLSKETADYIPKVLMQKTKYDTLFVKYRINEQINLGGLVSPCTTEVKIELASK